MLILAWQEKHNMLFLGSCILVKRGASWKSVYENNLSPICFELPQTGGCYFLSRLEKLLRWMAAWDCARMSMFTLLVTAPSTRPLNIVCVAPTVPRTLVQKFSHLLKGLITFSPHLDFQSFVERCDPSVLVRPKKSKQNQTKKDDWTRVWRQGQQSCLLALWLWSLDGATHIEGGVAVRRTAACVQLEEELIVLETDEAPAQLDCKAALWGEAGEGEHPACLAADWW